MPDGFLQASHPDQYLAIVLSSERREQFDAIFSRTADYAQTAVVSAVATTLAGKEVGTGREKVSSASSNHEAILCHAQATVLKLLVETRIAFGEATDAGVSFAAFKVLLKRTIRALSETFAELVSLDGLMQAVWRSIVASIYRRLLTLYNALKDAFKPFLKGLKKALKLAQEEGLTVAEKIHETISVALNTGAIVAEGIVSNLILAKIPILTPLMEFIVRCLAILVSSVFLAGSSLAHIHLDLCDVVRDRALQRQRIARQAALREAEDKADRLLQRLRDRGFKEA